MNSRAATPNDRLRMLWHVGVARSVLGDRSFGILVEKGWATPHWPRDGRTDRLHYKLTPLGQFAAIAQARRR